MMSEFALILRNWRRWRLAILAANVCDPSVLNFLVSDGEFPSPNPLCLASEPLDKFLKTVVLIEEEVLK